MWQWWVSRSSNAVVILASPNTLAHSLKLKLVDAPAVAMPAVYTYKGKEYVLFAAGGNAILTPRVGGQIVAFALPDAGS